MRRACAVLHAQPGDPRGHRGPLRLVSLPERIESGWWDDALIKRDYFIAEGEGAVRYWIYRERVSATAGEDEARWYLHGLFG
ncbi:hypothetical protein [Ralstonia pseudosolanacearum]|uniref:hypothetical protein n=1 Tax=Ralstonia pseudosolanacearum TaxID=1310165 RepID=UPI003D16AA7D